MITIDSFVELSRGLLGQVCLTHQQQLIVFVCVSMDMTLCRKHGGEKVEEVSTCWAT